MALYLVQHGLSLPKDQDPEQGLSPEGIADVERIADVAAGYNVTVARIEHSGKARAAQTAQLLGKYLVPTGGLHARSGLAPLDDVVAPADALDPTAQLMLVGHLPFLERLTGHLLVGDAERRVLRFQNGGIVCLDAESGAWFVKWALMPRIG
ncbi:MAG: phosphohistidine phosphatase SixA [bacterium]